MLPGTVLHENPRGRGGSREEVVGISWKSSRGSHYAAALVVTGAHRVVVYKAGESRRTHQWSFKPSSSTVFSHATVFLPASSRYVGVQQGASLVTWLEKEQDVKRPLSAKASGPVQAVHACPQLGDVFVVVLVSGAVFLYRGRLDSLARCDPSGEPDNGGGGVAAAEVVWSGVRGKRVLVLYKKGAEARINIFVLSLSAKRVPNSGMPAIVSASVTLASSHALPKPSIEAGCTAGTTADTLAVISSVDEGAEAYSAAWRTGSDGVLSVAWRSPRGAVWTKVVVSASGAREEFARSLSGTHSTAPAMVACAGGAVAALCNGHSPGEKKKSLKKAKSKHGAKGATSNQLVEHASSNGALACRVEVAHQCFPVLAGADGGRLLVHSGGTRPRLTIWDATYGVLLDDGESPEVTAVTVVEDAGAVAGRKAVSMTVSADGAQLALALGGKVVVCPLPVKETGTLASLLRRKRPATMLTATTTTTIATAADVFRLSANQVFPAVDLGRSSSAAHVLLQKTGVFADEEWEAAVVSPFRAKESAVIKALQDAAHRKDADAFERVLREHLQEQRQQQQQQQRAVPDGEIKAEGRDPEHTTTASGSPTPEVVGKHGGGGVDEGKEFSTDVASSRWEQGRYNRRRALLKGCSCSAQVLSAAIDLCISNPEANLWNALGLLLRSGGVSARNHRGLVAAIMKSGPQELLEEVVLHVPDLPEADVVQILRHFLARAAALARKPEISQRLAQAGQSNSQRGGGGDGYPPTGEVSKTASKGPPAGEMSKAARRRLSRYKADQKGKGAHDSSGGVRDESSQEAKTGDAVESDVNGGGGLGHDGVVGQSSGRGALKRRSTGQRETRVGLREDSEAPTDDPAARAAEAASSTTAEKDDRIKKKKKLLGIATPTTMVVTINETPSHERNKRTRMVVDGTSSAVPDNDASSPPPHKKSLQSNGTLANGHGRAHDDCGGTSSESGGVSEEASKSASAEQGRGVVEAMAAEGGREGKTPPNCNQLKTKNKKSVVVHEPAVARAERGVLVALTLPHNEAFLRAALSGLSHGEVIVVLQILTRLLSEGRTREAMGGGVNGKRYAVIEHDHFAGKGAPRARTEAVLSWASAVLDSHFARLAISGSENVKHTLKTLQLTASAEGECCDLLCQVRSLVDELGRRHAAAAEEHRRPKRTLYSVRQLCF